MTEESWKFQNTAGDFFAGLTKLKGLGFTDDDYIHQFATFAGAANLGRMIAISDLYRRTLGLNGHIAEVGVWKGHSFFMLAKLCEIFEPHAYTEVHGFDWFKGMQPGPGDTGMKAGSYTISYETIRDAIEFQKLGHIAKIFNVDATTQLQDHFAKSPARYRLVFLDAGAYAVVKASIPIFWERLVSGGIIIFDQYNEPRAPGETIAVSEMLPHAKIETLPWTRQPTAFVVKP